jgi:hypothetical protein
VQREHIGREGQSSGRVGFSLRTMRRRFWLPRRRRHRRSRPSVYVAITLMLLMTMPVSGANAKQRSDATMRLVGKIGLPSSCGIKGYGVDDRLGVLVLVQKCQFPGQGAEVRLRTYSTSSLALIASAHLNTSASDNPDYVAYASNPAAIDPVRHRIFLPFGTVFPDQPSRILVVRLSDLRPGARTVDPVQVITVPQSPATAIQAGAGGSPASPQNPAGALSDYALIPTCQFYDAIGGTLDVVVNMFYGGELASGSFTSGHGLSHDVYVDRFRVSDGKILWQQQLGQCVYAQSTVSSISAFGSDPVFAIHDGSGTKVVAGCLYQKGLSPGDFVGGALASEITLTGTSMLTYAIPLDANGMPISTAVSYRLGRPNSFGGRADPDSGRIFWGAKPPIRSDSFQERDAGPSAVVYDALHGMYIGAPTIGVPGSVPSDSPDKTFAVAAGGGRFYAAGRGGIVVVDARATPPGQGIVFPGYSASTSRAILDPRKRRLFVQPYGRPYFLVYQDDIPSVSPPPDPGPDTYTTQVAERAGVTSAQYSGHSEATGAVVRLVGGVSGLLKGASLGAYDFAAQNVDLSQLCPKEELCVAPDSATREITLAAIHGANLDTYQTNAQAIAASADARTKNDLDSRTGRNDTWPFHEIHCSDPGEPAGGQNYGGETTVSARCDRTKDITQAESQTGPFGLTLATAGEGTSQNEDPVSLPFSIGESNSWTRVHLDAKKGLVSEAVSSVRGFSFGDVRIDLVESESTCTAHGRTGTA